jgi:hypothetical protein
MDFKITEKGQRYKNKADIAIKITDAKAVHNPTKITKAAMSFFDRQAVYYDKLHQNDVFIEANYLAIGRNRSGICRYNGVNALPTNKIIIPFEHLFEIEGIDLGWLVDDTLQEKF